MALFNRGTSRAEPSNFDVFEAIKASAPVQAALSEAAARKVSDRQALVDSLTRMEVAAKRAFPVNAAKVDAAIAARKKAHEAFLATDHAVVVADGERSSASFAHTRLRDQIEGELRAGAPNTAIDEFIRARRDDDDATRKLIFSHTVTVHNAITEAKTARTTSNRESILARIAANNVAIASAEALRLVPDVTTINDDLVGLLAAIPPVKDAPIAGAN